MLNMVYYFRSECRPPAQAAARRARQIPRSVRWVYL